MNVTMKGEADVPGTAADYRFDIDDHRAADGGRAQVEQRRSDDSRELYAAQLALARHAYESNRLADCDTILARVAAIGGDLAEVSYRRGLLALERGDLAAAKTHLDASTQQGVVNPLVLNLLGEIAEQEGDHETAVRYFAALLALLPHDQGCWQRLVALVPAVHAQPQQR